MEIVSEIGGFDQEKDNQKYTGSIILRNTGVAKSRNQKESRQRTTKVNQRSKALCNAWATIWHLQLRFVIGSQFLEIQTRYFASEML